MKVSAQYAEAHFNDLIEAASNGVELAIALPEKSSLKLVNTGIPAPPKQAGRRVLGEGRGEMRSVSDGEWQAMNRHDGSDRMSSPPGAEARKERANIIGAGIGKFWLSPDAFTPEADAEIQQMFDEELERFPLP